MKTNNLYKSIALFLLTVYLSSCKNEGSSKALNASVNPFDTTHLTTQTLTEEDRAKLAYAVGKTVQKIKVEELSEKFTNAKNKLHVFCFWNINDETSVQSLKSINNIAESFDSTRLFVSSVHISDRPNTEGLNLFIRENQLTIDAFALDNTTIGVFMKKINKELSGEETLPIIFMIDKSNDTFLMYNRPMDEKELTAILQPLLL